MRFPEGLELRTYGQQLLAGREAKGWTQQQLSKKLFLPVHFIRALEAGEHGMLPEIPYVMSMYRKLAVAVDIDPEPMIQACKDLQERERRPSDEQDQQPQPGSVVHRRQPSSPGHEKQRKEPAKPEAVVAPQHTPQKKRRAGKGDGVIILVGCGLGLALVALVILNSGFWPVIRSRLITTDPDAETTEEIQDQAPQTSAVQQQPTTDIPDNEPVSPERQIGGPELGAVRFIFRSDVGDDRSSWIRIQDARGVVLFEGTPEPSDTLDLPVAAGIRVRLGRPGLVFWQQPGQTPQPIPESQPGVWVELIPAPAANQVVPATPEADPPAPAPEAPQAGNS